jgi:hypothetical protein
VVRYQEFPDFGYEIPLGPKHLLRWRPPVRDFIQGFEIPDFGVPKTLPLSVELFERSK